MRALVGAGLRAARSKCLNLTPELAGKLEGAVPVGATFIATKLYVDHHLSQGLAMTLVLLGLFGSGTVYALRRQGFTGLLEAVFQGVCVGGAAAALISLLIPKAPIQSIIGGLWTLGIWGYVIPATFLGGVTETGPGPVMSASAVGRRARAPAPAE